ncbi:hypothetical protein E3N88_26639 [Mikania micrantha]|uniref:Uncharacterized protein n=1 Tax=Mikania micrantha TaxID=192012 RepID=A0A5N6MUK5_9ASTR|nr:hypothetical protein E3N88_26639 [Mikania micrantha]
MGSHDVAELSPAEIDRKKGIQSDGGESRKFLLRKPSHVSSWLGSMICELKPIVQQPIVVDSKKDSLRKLVEPLVKQAGILVGSQGDENDEFTHHVDGV